MNEISASHSPKYFVTNNNFNFTNLTGGLKLSHQQFPSYMEIACAVDSVLGESRYVYCIRVFEDKITCVEIQSLGAAWELGLVQNHSGLIENEYNDKRSLLTEKEWCNSLDVDHDNCTCCMQVFYQKTIVPDDVAKNIIEYLNLNKISCNFKQIYEKHVMLVSSKCHPWAVGTFAGENFSKEVICPCCAPVFHEDMCGIMYRECKNLGLFRLLPMSLLCVETVGEMVQNQRTLLKKFATAKAIFETPAYQMAQTAIRASNPEIEIEGPWCPALTVGGSKRANSDIKWTPEMRPSCCVYDSIPCKNGYHRDHNHGNAFVHLLPIKYKHCGVNPELNYKSVVEEKFNSDVCIEKIEEVPVRVLMPKLVEAVGVPMSAVDRFPTMIGQENWSDMVLKQ